MIAAQVQTIVVPPTGEYATIDNKPSMAAISALGGADAKARQREIDAVLAHPDAFNPAVLYALSEALFKTGKKDEGTFWFYAAQLRARFDANRTTDETAREGVGIFNQRYGPAINQYAFTDLPKLEALVPRVVAWDRNCPQHIPQRYTLAELQAAAESGTDIT